MKEAQGHQADVAFDEELHTPDLARSEVSESESDVVYDRAAVRAAIDQLPAEFREVITLRELEDCSYKEIAESLEIPIGTVMSRLHRVRQKLSEELQDYAVEARIVPVKRE